MQKNTVTLVTVGSEYKKLPPIVCNGYSPDNDTALIVHKDPQGKGWNIAHKSGWAIVKNIRTRKEALRGATELGWLANWHNINVDNAAEWYKTNKEKMIEVVSSLIMAH